MARSTPGVTRARILTEAIRLFAAQGYTQTSVADIHVACGLAPGSGGLYKHFRSKRALLEEAVQRNLELMAQERAAVGDLPRDPRAALLVLGESVWMVMDRQRDLIRLMISEFANFPGIFGQMWQGVLANVYSPLATWITELCRSSGRGPADPEGAAAVILASLTYYPILDILIGRTPGELGRQRFLDAWAEHTAAALADAFDRAN
jgi:AcrR family transcriptional regulator